MNYQTLARGIFTNYRGKKLAIDTTGEAWDAYHKQICDFLGIQHFRREILPVDQPERYVGLFEYSEPGVHVEATIICENGELFLSPDWFTHIRMNHIGSNVFDLQAFPMVFTYDFTDGNAAITITGNYDWDIVGRTLKRTR